MYVFPLFPQSERADTRNLDQDQEAVYVYLRCGYHLIAQTLFQDAFSLFSKAHANPILVVRMFPDLIGTLLSGAGEVVKVPKGVEDQVREGISVDDFS